MSTITLPVSFLAAIPVYGVVSYTLGWLVRGIKAKRAERFYQGRVDQLQVELAAALTALSAKPHRDARGRFTKA